MPYPKKYVGYYHNLVEYLNGQGFAIYPMEMAAKEVVNEKHYFVDVVAMKDNKIWAFEYKSYNDSVKRAILQIENYRKCFDFAVVVGTNLRKLLKYRDVFQKLGAGLWHLKRGKVTVLEEPKKQPPIPLTEPSLYHPQCKTIRDVMMDKFLINTGRKKKREKIVGLGEFYEGIKQSQLVEFSQG